LNAEATKNPAAFHRQSDYEVLVVNSCLWAAAGDALGWMTELARDSHGVRHRTGLERVQKPVNWRRLIGGKNGVKVDFSAGTYSDDTQLRLAVSRSIRGNGAFDVEAFAKIEMTVWQGYSLGAGIGSKAAATHLSKRGVNWFSNFFDTSRQKYITAGGNGAAMRVQPHVWSARSTQQEMVRQVLRDSIVTHGHPHGFCGAVFHALCLWDTFADRKIPGLGRAKDYIDFLGELPALIQGDSELAQFWLPSWERAADSTISSAIKVFQEDAFRDIQIVQKTINYKNKNTYKEVLGQIGCLTDEFRGSGFKTALAALCLSMIYSEGDIEYALAASANELESDTDTIATMAGALLGALSERSPIWSIQDRAYLECEARRLACIGSGIDQPSFSYPDVSGWEPPSNQSDSVARFNGALALTGLGVLTPRGDEYQQGTSIWQWFELPFGQTVFAKRRSEISRAVVANQMPGKLKNSQKPGLANVYQDSFAFDEFSDRKNNHRGSGASRLENLSSFPGIDEATDIVIASGFDDATIGHLIKLCIDKEKSIELVVAFSAIVAKARLARMKRK
tara:strand:- start:1364 stop:3055 length:1692 start_codon:yes stop_codon:yes gene_type:complete